MAVKPEDIQEGNEANPYQRGEFTVDTREARPANQTGLRLELEAEHGSNIRSSSSNWVRYGGSVESMMRACQSAKG